MIEIYPRKIAVILGAFTDMVIFRRGMFAVSMAGEGGEVVVKGMIRASKATTPKYDTSTRVFMFSKVFRIFYLFRNLA